MVNEIAWQEFSGKLNEAFKYAEDNGLSVGVMAWLGDAFDDRDKEPFTKENPPWSVKNSEFFMKTWCEDDKDRLEKIGYFVVRALHEGIVPPLVRCFASMVVDACKDSEKRFIKKQLPPWLTKLVDSTDAEIHVISEDEAREILEKHPDKGGDETTDCEKCDDDTCPNNPKNDPTNNNNNN